MSKFIKYIPSEKASWLREHFTSAFLLLSFIAEHARRTHDNLDGLEIGDCFVGEIETSAKSGLSSKEYRNALIKLEELGFIETVWNPKNKKQQKRAIKRAIKSKIVNLIDSSIWNINLALEGDQNGNQRAIKGRSKGDKQEEMNIIHDDDDAGASPLQKKEKVMNNEFTKSELYRQSLRLEKDWTPEEIEDAWARFEPLKEKVTSPLNYIEGIINKQRTIAKALEEKKCHSKQKKKPLNTSSSTANEFFSVNDTSEAPLAIFVRQGGLKIK